MAHVGVADVVQKAVCRCAHAHAVERCVRLAAAHAALPLLDPGVVFPCKGDAGGVAVVLHGATRAHTPRRRAATLREFTACAVQSAVCEL